MYGTVYYSIRVSKIRIIICKPFANVLKSHFNYVLWLKVQGVYSKLLHKHLQKVHTVDHFECKPNAAPFKPLEVSDRKHIHV